jgi:hypothetical protein
MSFHLTPLLATLPFMGADVDSVLSLPLGGLVLPRAQKSQVMGSLLEVHIPGLHFI